MTKRYEDINELSVIFNEYDDPETISLYEEFRNEIGILEIEKYLVKKYIEQEDAILEVGCGTGRVTFEMYYMGYHNITALDICANMIESCQKYAELCGQKIEFVQCDMQNYMGKSYDSITFWFNGLMIIPSYSRRRQCVHSVYNHLKDGGYFIFTTPIIDENYNWKAEKSKWRNRN